jgi:hypothetical protein
MDAVQDRTERAIGFAGLHRSSHMPEHGALSEQLSREVDDAITDAESYEWIVDMGDIDTRAWAYLRPDLRLRFELAVRALGCRSQDIEAIKELTFLLDAMFSAFYCWASTSYASDLIAGREPAAPREIHASLLQADERSWPWNIAKAQGAFNEYRLQAALGPRYRPVTGRVPVTDPVYGAIEDLVAPAPGAPLSGDFVGKIEGLIEEKQLAAAAGVLGFAAEARPEYVARLLELGARLVRACGSETPAARVEVLSFLASAPQFAAELVDLPRLLRDAETCAQDRWEYWVPSDSQARIFAALIARRDAAAVDKLYRAASDNWEFAMRLLESAAARIGSTADPNAASAWARAVRRGLECVADTAPVPAVVNGVDLEALAYADADPQRRY